MMNEDFARLKPIMTLEIPLSTETEDSSGETTVNHVGNDDGAIIGVEIFEESDIECDDNRLQLYSDAAEEVVNHNQIVLPPILANNTDQVAVAVKMVTEVSKNSPNKSDKKCKSLNNREHPRLSLEDRIKCIRMCSRYDSYADAQKAWKMKYTTPPPCRKTLAVLNKKFERTGSVADLIRTGRPKSTRTEEKIAMVEEAVRNDPSKSVRTIAKELGINSASVHRIRKDFEDKRNTLKMENKKLKDSLNDALKRVEILEKRLTRSMYDGRDDSQTGVETLVITTPSGEETDLSNQSNVQSSITGLNAPTIIALNSSNGQISLPSVLRLQQGTGQEAIHIITLPQGLLSLDDCPIQLSMAAINELESNINIQPQQPCTSVPTVVSTLSTNINP